MKTNMNENLQMTWDAIIWIYTINKWKDLGGLALDILCESEHSG